jgi:transcriptional regulator with XRE-family HTH domain
MFENLGTALALLRGVCKFSQAEAARRAGVGKSQLSKYENGKELPKLDSLERVLSVYGVGADGLFTVVRVLDGWTATAPPENMGEATLLSALPGTSFPGVDQAFRVVLLDLLNLQRAMLEALLRPVAVARSPQEEDDLGILSRD